MKIKILVYYVLIIIFMQNTVFGAVLAEQQYIDSVNSGLIESWFTPTPGWNQSSWGRWKYFNANDAIRKISGDPYVGTFAIGWCKIDSNWYYFDPNNNIMVSSSVVNGFQLGNDGKMINNGIEPTGMDYDTIFSYLKVTNNSTQIENNKQGQIYIINEDLEQINEFVTIRKPIFAGDNNNEVNSINEQFDKVLEKVMDDNIDYEDINEKVEIFAQVDNILKHRITIKIIAIINNRSKTIDNLCYDREKQHLTTFSEYWKNK